MKIISLLILSILTLVGCGERAADIKNPNPYSKNGLKFSYPGNWTITSDEGSDSFHHLIVETSGDGIVGMSHLLLKLRGSSVGLVGWMSCCG
jgi:hypothetical protein